MTNEKPTRGRPREPDPKTCTYQVRLTKGEDADLQRVLAARNAALASAGVTMRPPDLIRSWLLREVRELDGASTDDTLHEVDSRLVAGAVLVQWTSGGNGWVKGDPALVCQALEHDESRCLLRHAHVVARPKGGE